MTEGPSMHADFDDGSVERSLVTLLAELKIRLRELEAVSEREAQWKARVDLARSHGREDLLRAALEELERTSTNREGLEQTTRALRSEIEALRAAIQRRPGELAFRYSDSLLTELSLLVGDKASGLDEAFRNLQAEQELHQTEQALQKGREDPQEPK